MKSTLLTISLAFIHSIIFAQSIVWEENQFNGSNLPFYTGGFSRISIEFADIDGDNDLDCFIGSSNGNVAFFQNINNSSSPSWKLVTLNYIDINLLILDRIKVCFVDIDNDEDLDMFIGGNSSPINYSPLIFYKNIGTKFSAEWELMPDFLNDIEVNEHNKFCFPAFVDIDNDMDYDLIYGDYMGYCIYYENTGDEYSYNFSKRSSNFFDLPKFSNYPNIAFYDVDGDTDLDAFVGTHYNLAFIENTGTPENAVWEKDTTNYHGINKTYGTYFSPESSDLNNDGNTELYVGTLDGQILTYHSTCNNWIKYKEIFFDEGNHLNPEFADLDGDSKVELYVPSYDAYYDTSYILKFKNTGTQDSIVWALIPDTMSIYFPYPLNRVTFADIDDDDDLDLIAGFKTNYTEILLYENIGTQDTPIFSDNFEIIAHFSKDDLFDFYPLLVDYDNDSDLDLLISAQNGTTNSYGWVDFYENTGDSVSYNWEFSSSQVLGYGSIACVDDDKDEDLDLLFGFFNYITILQNNGNVNEPMFNGSHILKIENANNGFSGIALTDLNNDNHNDLIIGTNSGGLLRYDNKGFTDNIEAFDKGNITVFPNPALDYINISGLDLSKSNYSLLIYTVLGQFIGKYKISNNVVSLPELNNGLYIYRLQQDKATIKIGKLIIEKNN